MLGEDGDKAMCSWELRIASVEVPENVKCEIEKFVGNDVTLTKNYLPCTCDVVGDREISFGT